MLARAGADLTSALDVTAEEARELEALAARFSLDDLMACARVFARNEAPPKGLPVPQLAVELSLLECLSVRRGVAAPSVAPASPAKAPPPRAEVTPLADAPPPRTRVAAAPAPASLDLAAVDAGTWSGPTNGATPHSAPATRERAPEEPRRHDPAPAVEADSAPHSAMPAAGDGRDWVAEALDSWPLIRKLCRQKPPMGAMVSGLLSAVDPARCEPGSPPTLILRAKFDAHVTKLRDQNMRQIIEWALEQALGATLRVRVVSASEAVSGEVVRNRVQQEARNEPAPLDGDASAAQSAPAPHVYERRAATRAQAPADAPTGVAGVTDGERGNSGRSEVRERPAAKPRRSTEHLEKAAREDPVVKEFVRALKTEVAEVRSLDADEQPDE